MGARLEEVAAPTTVESYVGVTSKAEKSASVHLGYLDGVRGLAALYVALSHTVVENEWKQGHGLSHPLFVLTRLVILSHFAVAVFIVLSGYCLMLPVARSARGELKGGLIGYLKRRARRILPPYYFALLLSLLLIALVPDLHRPEGRLWDKALPAFTPGVLVSHLLVIHNLSGAWIDRINPPFWSVATEWQIYFVFPLLLLPVWRRFGIAALIVVGFAVGLAPHFLLHGAFDEACPWYIGLFACGMVGAVIGFSRDAAARAWKERIPWGVAFGLAAAFLAAAAVLKKNWLTHELTYSEPIVGIATTCLLIFCAQALSEREPASYPAVLRLFNSRRIAGLGAFSYSLYLIHVPILTVLHSGLRHMGLSDDARFLLLLFVGIPLSLACAYLFHLAFERRFMSANAPGKKGAA